MVLGRDGLPIDSEADPALLADDLAAHVPAIVGAADDFGVSAKRGHVSTAVLEYADGFAVISVLSDVAVLLVLLRPDANVAQLLHELRRHRERLATLA